MTRGWVFLWGAVTTVVGLGCGVITVGGRPVDAQQEPPAEADESKGKELPRIEWRSIAGDWGTSYGKMTIVENGKDFTGSYPDGTLRCKYDGKRYFEYQCEYQDSEGKGPAFVWYDGKGLRGEWKDAKGRKHWWEFCKGQDTCEKVIVSGSTGATTLTLKNKCSYDVSFCIETGGAVQKSRVGKGSYTTYDVKPGAKIWARSGKGLNDGECTSLLGAAAGTAATETFVVCE